MCSWRDYQHLGAVPGQVRHELEEAAAVLEQEQGLVPAPELEPSPGWPAPGQPCDEEAECGRSCYFDEASGWVYEGQRGGGGYAIEDVQFYCQCEHHQPVPARTTP